MINLPWSDRERIRSLVDGLGTVPATVHLAPDPNLGWTRNPVVSRVGYFRTMRLSRAPMTLKDQILKRAFDLSVASILLVMLAPLLAVIALLVKLARAGASAVPATTEWLQPEGIPCGQVPHHDHAR